MPRKRSHVESSKGVQWSEDDTVELFAQLDLILGNPQKSRCNSDKREIERDMAMVALRLHKALNERFSPDEIADKLHSEFAKGTMYPEHNRQLILQLGSSAFSALSATMVCMIDMRKDDIRLRTPRKSRATSQHPEFSHRRSTSTRQETPSKVTPRKAIPKGPRPVASPRAATPKAKRKRKRRRRQAPDPLPSITTPTPENRPSNITTEIKQPLQEDLFNTELDNSSAEVVDANNLSNTASLAQEDTLRNGDDVIYNSHPEHKAEEETIAVPAVEHEEMRRSLFYQDKLMQAEAVSNELRLDRFDFQRKLEEAQAEIVRLEMVSRESQARMAKSKNIPLNTQDELRKKDTQITRLKHRMATQAFLRPYLEQDNKQLAIERFDKFRLQYGKLRSSLESIFNFSDLEHSSITNTAEKSPDLDNLLRTTAGVSDALSSESPGPALGDTLSANELAWSLTGAAVRDWVFLERFNFTALTSTPLLEKYRSLIIKAWNEDICHGLDLAAHQSLIDGTSFQDIDLPRLTSKLAERYLTVLQLLTPHEPDSMPVHELKLTLQAVFRAALEIKLLLIVSKETYECIWPAVGSPFDKESMEAVDSKPSAEKQAMSGFQNARVKLALIPGLRAYAHQRGLMDYHGFKRDGEEIDGESWVVARAVVLV